MTEGGARLIVERARSGLRKKMHPRSVQIGTNADDKTAMRNAVSSLIDIGFTVC
jgi:hypothetical protein